MDLGRLHFEEVTPVADGNLVRGEVAFRVHRRVRLRDEVMLLAVGGQIVDLLGHAAILDLAVRRFDEPKLVDPGEGAHGRDQTDVRAFRRLNGTDAAVVRGMHVTYLEPSPVSGKTSRPEGAQAALVRQLGQRIGLVHELAQLRAAEEVADDRAQRLRVNELLRGHAVHVHVEQGHTLLDQALRAGEAHAALIGQEFAHGADAAATQVINVVQGAFTPTETDEVFHRSDEVFRLQRALAQVGLHGELLVELVTTNAAQVVLLRIEE